MKRVSLTELREGIGRANLDRHGRSEDAGRRVREGQPRGSDAVVRSSESESQQSLPRQQSNKLRHRAPGDKPLRNKTELIRKTRDHQPAAVRQGFQRSFHNVLR